MAAPLYVTQSGRLWHAGLILIVTVGLPARGKTHISRALERYLRWLGVKTRVYSIGDYRRKVLGGAKDVPHDYFQTKTPRSEATNALRRRIKAELEDQIMDFFTVQGGQVVIYDANNGSVAERKSTLEKFGNKGVHVIYLESLCDQEDIITANIRSVKLSSPDYAGWDAEKAVADYWERIRDQTEVYDTVTADEGPFIKVMNVGERIEVNRIEGYLQTRCCFFLMNIHTRPRNIYFARSGQSLIEHSYKADSDLSPAGWEYAERLKAAVIARRKAAREERKAKGEVLGEENPLLIWTSARRRAYHTAWPFVHSGYKVVQKPIMSEINPGVWDGLSTQEAMELYPDEWTRFLADPYAHRAPRAESYHDLSVRLESVIFELERCQDDLLIIGHASVIRCLLAYLVGLPPNEVPAVEIARGDLVEITPASYGVISRAWHFWSGEGRGDAYGENLYENFAEATSGKGSVLPDSGVNFAADALNMEKEAEEEEGREKEERGEKVMEAAKAVGKIAEQAAANTAAGAGVANSSGDGAGAGGVGQGARGPGKALKRWGSERGKGRGLPGLSELNETDEGEENKDKDDGGVVSEGEGEGRESGKTRSRAMSLLEI
ncbi:6-phosphofructo-2-kinase/fructose-2,6-bisphosphatase [Cryptococcus neoformans C23]|uniref:6-phosphofructo-2-kinase/fructose-2, 6-bisphosphatase n=1 Tax=Cryptococcus neoformans (strain H99 / ATCC 208821 / CBS 10515 / FGSC 9487) TaxID=235443 RepID=J9VH91_CRYN9|nr:6-phosphofructo-2-kinase/fructose-2,6-bisphosphatase [Cryptococcus neoformans var. grubii H99]AFR92746.2 6-phosphofructo-2-kinase/fructose-2,6-bisphosphatase [Cryptococcus neoformans var. grubii H99]AUB22211.1 6-phosphofructo-2-kinase/fructose-2,6-bisphosphatase [Cryptococcus neoformans var. grubii]OWZ48203.1 6-phosphofructo-2-kinase/fructose-2,6-bisphosphatase [Cryptococcus neoformans var. grubii C23]OXC87003.1 6-phosphofructo-2-kinase/fructose-2,6-bisphosphatase [Cryptococcus neoformans va|eukprot:XP_012046365.1 6-phosphofructo-2-kinase/fructose-2,6-bisphosphatase [Cryptococcus neoformans var. grubii H99]